MKGIGVLRAALILGVIAVITPAWAVDGRASFEQVVDQLLTSGDFEFKKQNAHKLSELAAVIDWNETDTGLIHKIEILMLDDVENVRMWAALAANKIGKPAIRTLPTLYKALDLGSAGMFPPGKGGFHSGPSASSIIPQAIWFLEGNDKLSPAEQGAICNGSGRLARSAPCSLLESGKSIGKKS